MKKFLLMLLILMCLVLSGCGKKNDPVSSIKNTKINIDQQTLNEANQGIQKFRNGN